MDHQPQSREGSWHYRAAAATRARRWGDRIKMPFAAVHESVYDTEMNYSMLVTMRLAF
jgi:hypothetical protein